MTLEQYLATLAIIAIATASAIVFAIAWHFLRAVGKRNAKTIAPKPIDLDGMRLFRSIARNGCPDCNGFGFYAGPRGGASQHIYCVNPKCRAAFNVTHFTPSAGRVERIESKSEEWYANAE